MSKEFITCPYCKHEHEDMCDYPWVEFERNVQEPVTMDCDNCGKTFLVSCETSYTFDVSK